MHRSSAGTRHAVADLTYLRMSNFPAGLLLNFHPIRLKDGLRRFVG
jgi:hypothetical protein